MPLYTVQTIDHATPVLQAAAAVVTPPSRLWQRTGRVAQQSMQKQARSKPWRRLGVAIARATQLEEVTDSTATIRVRHVAAAQKQFGGRISAPGQHSPSPAKALTIPIAPEAEGKRVGEFVAGGAQIFRIKTHGPASDALLAMKTGTGPDDFKVLYVLKRAVNQDPDPWYDEGILATAMEREAVRMIGDAIGG